MSKYDDTTVIASLVKGQTSSHLNEYFCPACTATEDLQNFAREFGGFDTVTEYDLHELCEGERGDPIMCNECNVCLYDPWANTVYAYRPRVKAVAQ